jgi:hypothetical protein
MVMRFDYNEPDEDLNDLQFELEEHHFNTNAAARACIVMGAKDDQHPSASESASEEWGASQKFPKGDNIQKKGYFSILKETVTHPNIEVLRVPKINVWQRKDHLLEEFPSNKRITINWNPFSRQSDHGSRGSRQSSNGNIGGDVKRNDDQKKTKEWHDNYDTSTKEQCNMAPCARKSSICQSQLVHGELIQQNDKCRAKRRYSTDDILSHQLDLELPPSDSSMDLSFSGSLTCGTSMSKSWLDLQNNSQLLELDNNRKHHGGLAPLFDN